MQFALYRDFKRSLKVLQKKRNYGKAVAEIDGMIRRVTMGEDPLEGMQRTHQGESRIRHCVKYDLVGACRLVTIQHQGLCICLFVGTHDDSSAWLEKNRGLVPTVGTDGIVSATYVTTDEETAVGEAPLTGASLGPLFQRLLPEELYDQLVETISTRLRRRIEDLDCTVEDSELKALAAEIVDKKRSDAVYDVFSLLKQDRAPDAARRVQLFTGAATPIEEFPIDLLPDTFDSDLIRRIPVGSKAFGEMIRRLMASNGYKDWMLFLHPDQETIVEENFAGPAKLVGVSGSGKTCVVIRRAVRLAERYPSEKILIVTINPALAALIRALVAECAPADALERIAVKPLFEICCELMAQFEPQNQLGFTDITWRGNEHVDEIWQEFYRCELNNYDARVLQPVHDTLLTRSWSPERYLREEIDWLRSALRPGEREGYLEIKRQGRALPLTKQFRQRIIEGAGAWQQKMKDVGVVDSLGVCELLGRYRHRIKPAYRCVLVDEGQDFGNMELDLVRRMVAEGENDLFIAGDAAQAVTTKYQSLAALNMVVPGARSRRLALNYRNSRDILTAAFAILEKNMSEELIDREDFMVLKPELSAFSAQVPLLLEAPSLGAELECALRYIQSNRNQNLDWKACIAICGYTLRELQVFGRKHKLTVLDGQVSVDDGSVFVSDLEQTKGFEFDIVCILNCSEGVLPDGVAPDSEQHRDLARLYVAMTRAKTELVLSWSGRQSPFLRGVDEHIAEGSWSDFVEDWAGEQHPIPARLESHRSEGVHLKDWRAMTGEEFLYTPSALGLTPELISKVRELVDGIGLRQGRMPKKWKTMGAAIEDAKGIPATKLTWGPEMHRQLLVLAGRVASPQPN
jgi:hypothetical protein